jgi:hypothetical protein
MVDNTAPAAVRKDKSSCCDRETYRVRLPATSISKRPLRPRLHDRHHLLGKRPAFIVEVHRGRLGNRIHGAPVIAPEELVHLRGYPVVASVAAEKPRRQIREAMGFEETRHFVCAA